MSAGAIEVTLPQYGMGMNEGTVTHWLIAVGDEVVEGQPIVEIEAAKASIEVEAPASGVLREIVVAEGVTVPVQTVLCYLGAAGDRFAAAPESTAPAPAHAPAPAPVETAPPPAALPSAPIETKPAVGAAPRRRQVEPRAIREARRLGVDIEAVAGSGPGGRVVAEDVTSLASTAEIVSAAAAVAAAIAQTAASIPAAVPGMTRSEAPHFYLTIEIAMEALLAAQDQIGAVWLDRALSLDHLLIKAAGAAMSEMPEMNVVWNGDSIVRPRSIDLGVQVTTPTGSSAPILRNVGGQGLRAIARDLDRLSEAAMAGTLEAQDGVGGVMTLYNLGAFGVRAFSAVIPAHQSAVLALGAVEKRPVVREDQLAIGQMMSCTLSVDHRVIDGGVAAKFLSLFQACVEQPLRML